MENAEEFLSDPQIVEHYTLLNNIGVFKRIDNLNQTIKDYQSLLNSAADLFNRTSIDEIIDSTVLQISNKFLPSFLVFLWKPLQNRPDITIKSYQNYKLVDLSIRINTINCFEHFFQENRGPIKYDLMRRHCNNEAAAGNIRMLDTLAPEIIIPILGPTELYGLILVGAKLLASEYIPQELTYLEQLMSFVSQAIQNNLHYQHSVRDVKTGLFNHGFFSTRLAEELARANRGEINSSLIVIDVDKFKTFNDNYGHLAGDKVLESLAHTLKQNVRSQDVPSRFGGEEFTVLLPNTGETIAYQVAERIRGAVASMRVPWEPPLPQVTISLGVVTFNDKSLIKDADEIIHRADEALYKSKENGRNRTTAWRGGLLQAAAASAASVAAGAATSAVAYATACGAGGASEASGAVANAGE